MTPSTRRDRATLVLPLAGAGAVIGHGVGYGALAPVGHGHLAMVGPAVTLAGGIALALGAVRSLRRRDLRPTVGSLAVAQLVIYSLLEVAEHTVGALDPGALVSPAVLGGLVAQLPVAWLLARMFRVASEALAKLVTRADVPVAAAPVRWRPSLSVPHGERPWSSPGSPRGPPLAVVV